MNTWTFDVSAVNILTIALIILSGLNNSILTKYLIFVITFLCIMKQSTEDFRQQNSNGQLVISAVKILIAFLIIGETQKNNSAYSKRSALSGRGSY